jgi:hypothetical protein
VTPALLPWVVLWAMAPGVAAEVDRLVGQTVTVMADGSSYTIVDIAGEGPPIVGVVERRGQQLWLDRWRLAGPLAVPRIAGPGYKVWVIGDIEGDRLTARRIGILRPP